MEPTELDLLQSIADQLTALGGTLEQCAVAAMAACVLLTFCAGGWLLQLALYAARNKKFWGCVALAVGCQGGAALAQVPMAECMDFPMTEPNPYLVFKFRRASSGNYEATVNSSLDNCGYYVLITSCSDVYAGYDPTFGVIDGDETPLDPAWVLFNILKGYTIQTGGVGASRSWEDVGGGLGAGLLALDGLSTHSKVTLVRMLMIIAGWGCMDENPYLCYEFEQAKWYLAFDDLMDLDCSTEIGSGCTGDADCDGIPDGEDPDPDGDGTCEGDMDCDGVPDGDDPDPDGDGEPGCEGDMDCDGTPDGDDPDPDGDGEPGCEGDMDCDGTPDGDDPDPDGDGEPGCEGDMDCDGTPDGDDPDPDGDGEPGCENDNDCDGIPNPDDPTPDGPCEGDEDCDGVPDDDDPDPDGDGLCCPGDHDCDGEADAVDEDYDPEYCPECEDCQDCLKEVMLRVNELAGQLIALLGPLGSLIGSDFDADSPSGVEPLVIAIPFEILGGVRTEPGLINLTYAEFQGFGAEDSTYTAWFQAAQFGVWSICSALLLFYGGPWFVASFRWR